MYLNSQYLSILFFYFSIIDFIFNLFKLLGFFKENI